MARFELATLCLQGRCNNHYATPAFHIFELNKKYIFLLEVGFEPTPPKRMELKSTALDHSAIQATILF